jgi:hypothetical protein
MQMEPKMIRKYWASILCISSIVVRATYKVATWPQYQFLSLTTSIESKREVFVYEYIDNRWNSKLCHYCLKKGCVSTVLMLVLGALATWYRISNNINAQICGYCHTDDPYIHISQMPYMESCVKSTSTPSILDCGENRWVTSEFSEQKFRFLHS